jgi:hypothetical protein
MTWKSTAVAGLATVTATWLASYAPVRRTAQATAHAPSIEHTETAAAEIQREAARLHARLAQVGAYRDPARNPFRYRAAAPAPAAARPQPSEPIALVEDVAASTDAPPTLRMTLSGIAEDIVGDATVRTAIISTPSDVLLVKVGETVGDQYRVENIAADAVELVRLDTGMPVRLSLKP